MTVSIYMQAIHSVRRDMKDMLVWQAFECAMRAYEGLRKPTLTRSIRNSSTHSRAQKSAILAWLKDAETMTRVNLGCLWLVVIPVSIRLPPFQRNLLFLAQSMSLEW